MRKTSLRVTPDEPIFAALSLGGNMGDVRAAFRFALEKLALAEGVAVVATSSIYRTAPWGKTDQPDFLNMAALLRTQLAPRVLLDLCLSIERDHGRLRNELWGPRTLDIDVLTYGDAQISEPGLSIPHPRLHERVFALAPLAEIAPDTLVAGERAEILLGRLDARGVTRTEGL